MVVFEPKNEQDVDGLHCLLTSSSYEIFEQAVTTVAEQVGLVLAPHKRHAIYCVTNAVKEVARSPYPWQNMDESNRSTD